MVSFAKILIPIDFSERCLGAARFSIPLAERFQSEITLLHVAPTPEAPPEGAPEWYEERQTRAEKKLRDFLCAAFAHLNVQRVLRVGDDVAEEIIKYAGEHGSSLIMMPTRGFGPFRRFLLGSVTSKVLHDAKCPVWTGAHVAQGPPAEWLRPSTVLGAVDTTPEDTNTLISAADVARQFGATLLLVHVAPRLEAPGEDRYSHEYNGMALAEANTKLVQLQKDAGTSAEMIVEAGPVAHAVRSAAERLNADLLVVGRGRAVASGRLGLNTYGIIR